MGYHSDQDHTTGIHPPFDKVWADSAARLAEDFDTGDLHKLGYQLDTPSTVWMVQDTGTDNVIPLTPMYSNADVSNPPTAAELNAAYPFRVAGTTIYINDNGAGTNFYQVVFDGTDWWIFTGTKAT